MVFRLYSLFLELVSQLALEGLQYLNRYGIINYRDNLLGIVI